MHVCIYTHIYTYIHVCIHISVSTYACGTQEVVFVLDEVEQVAPPYTHTYIYIYIYINK